MHVGERNTALGLIDIALKKRKERKKEEGGKTGEGEGRKGQRGRRRFYRLQE